MADEDKPKSAIPAIAEPWINLLHTIGLPWTLIVLSAWFGVPFATDLLKKQDGIDEKLKRSLDLHEKANANLEKLVWFLGRDNKVAAPADDTASK